MKRSSIPITSSRHRIWKIAGIVAGALLVILLAKTLSGEAVTTEATATEASTEAAPHFWQQQKVRTVLVAAADEPPARTSSNETLSTTLVEGTLPPGATKARVLTDTDCAPDAQGISHCLNRLAVGDTEVVVQHHHNMHQVSCLTPGEVVNLQRM